MSFQIGDQVILKNDYYDRKICRVVLIDGDNVGIIPTSSYDNWLKRPTSGSNWSVEIVKKGDLKLYEHSFCIQMTASQVSKLLHELDELDGLWRNKEVLSELMLAEIKMDGYGDRWLDIRDRHLT